MSSDQSKRRDVPLQTAYTEREQVVAGEQLLAAIVASSDDAIISKTLNGIITSWNDSAVKLFGYTAEEAIGRHISLIIPPELLTEEDGILARLRQGLRIDHYETVRVTKDGRKLDVLLSISPVKDRQGTIVGAAKVARDITERKRLEARQRQLFNSNLIGVFISDFAGTFLDANDAFLDLLGYTREELLAGSMRRDELTPPEFWLLSQNAVKALQETGSSSTYEKEYLHKSGKRIPVLVAVTRIEQTEMCIGFVLDISERKELDRRKDEFISLASHELKTPVTSLKGFVYVLRRRLSKQGDDQATALLAKIDKQIDRLTALINDLLDLSKIQAGKLDYRVEPFDLDALVLEIVGNVQGSTHSHRLLVEGLTHAQVLGDRDRIEQVLTNLLANAIKYSPQADRVIVHLSRDQASAVVNVQDFGIGIAKEHQQHIFERFYQVTDPAGQTYPGLGIGLYLSCEIIKRHHGRLWVESDAGQGATFSFSLPIVGDGI